MSLPSSTRSNFPDPQNADNIQYFTDREQLRDCVTKLYSEKDVPRDITTDGSLSFKSKYTSRSADKTKNNIDHNLLEQDEQDIQAAVEQLEERDDLICMDYKIGDGKGDTGRLILPEEYSRIALSLSNLMEPTEADDPDYRTAQLPDWEGEIKIRVDAYNGETYVLGSDYTGEAKKSFLRLFMHDMKENYDGLGLHAGTKTAEIEKDGEIEEVGQLYLGLSGTGKSTLTSHSFGLKDEESTEMHQDDVVGLLPNGEVLGSEGNGLYIKTIGLERDEQPELYDAATDRDAILENVKVDLWGNALFDRVDDESGTTNTRAAIHRENLESASEDIDMDSVDQTFFITRNPLMPPVAKLDHDEAAAAFMLGESVQTSAGDPEKAGEPINVVGTNPFIIGSKGQEGNKFHELMNDLDTETYLVNTGYVGNEDNDIGVDDTVGFLEKVTRGETEWLEDQATGLKIPENLDEEFYPPTQTDNYDAKMESLTEDRQEWLEQFEELDENIKKAVQ